MSIVRRNLLSQLNYTPFCGNTSGCNFGMPRSTFSAAHNQFVCKCGWRSSFETAFIQQYQAAQTTLATSAQ